jgi:hypothetical protein
VHGGNICFFVFYFFMGVFMTTPSITETLVPSIEVLGKTLTRMSECYQQLLTQPTSHDFCHEAGRSLRYLSGRYASVLLAALDYQPAVDEDEDDLEDEEELSLEED